MTDPLSLQTFRDQLLSTSPALVHNLLSATPEYIKALKNFDKTGVSGFLLDTLESRQKARKEANLVRAIYELYLSLVFLQERVERLSDESGQERLTTLLEQYFNHSLAANRQEKIELFRNLLLNGANDSTITIDSLTTDQTLLSELTFLQLQILKQYDRVQGKYSYRHLMNNHIVFEIKDLVRYLGLPAESRVDVFGGVADLARRGLLVDWGIGRTDYSGPEFFVLSEYGMVVIKRIQDPTRENVA